MATHDDRVIRMATRMRGSGARNLRAAELNLSSPRGVLQMKKWQIRLLKEDPSDKNGKSSLGFEIQVRKDDISSTSDDDFEFENDGNDTRGFNTSRIRQVKVSDISIDTVTEAETDINSDFPDFEKADQSSSLQVSSSRTPGILTGNDSIMGPPSRPARIQMSDVNYTEADQGSRTGDSDYHDFRGDETSDNYFTEVDETYKIRRSGEVGETYKLQRSALGIISEDDSTIQSAAWRYGSESESIPRLADQNNDYRDLMGDETSDNYFTQADDEYRKRVGRRKDTSEDDTLLPLRQAIRADYQEEPKRDFILQPELIKDAQIFDEAPEQDFAYSEDEQEISDKENREPIEVGVGQKRGLDTILEDEPLAKQPRIEEAEEAQPQPIPLNETTITGRFQPMVVELDRLVDQENPDETPTVNLLDILIHFIKLYEPTEFPNTIVNQEALHAQFKKHALFFIDKLLDLHACINDMSQDILYIERTKQKYRNLILKIRKDQANVDNQLNKLRANIRAKNQEREDICLVKDKLEFLKLSIQNRDLGQGEGKDASVKLLLNNISKMASPQVGLLPKLKNINAKLERLERQV
ncbi:uncharacterized protein J8A68_000709 [[Candida] subhashii]|uniref:Uncharacterized protein n=1 Tax=[Candida] subhashii TaxID=561895 RepID=A0A8J5V547_9ASCO|nr:uncharacterized protein J8A68_000709 [[Candida] subhashii]KAG7665689.1 hypothetical protein J8A68_000709 [[Candida] subhashii]